MRLSVVINTCCLGPRAHEITGSWTFTPHALRAYSLGNFILPFYRADASIDEILVAGEFVEGEGYRYVPCPSTHFSCIDALAQRQAAFEAATGDVIVFHHDDHMIDYTFAAKLKTADMTKVDVILPERRRRTMGGHEVLNNGGKDGYISGHCVVMTREACEKAPWNAVQHVFEWDVSHTRLIAAAGLRALHTDLIWCWDVEVGGAHERPAIWEEREDPKELV